MNVLLDTQALIWWLAGDDALGTDARALIEDENNQVFVSAASAMEISTKYFLGELPEAGLVATRLEQFQSDQGVVEMTISITHAALAGNLQIAGQLRPPRLQRTPDATAFTVICRGPSSAASGRRRKRNSR